ncbi:GDP-L-galactose phosphorylase 1-like [Magnolia sinica]|uniref:GDP-L-galactose phosphorylase 1-like n=1 Tax=Magnolia sinica TaxID=86752 RepID=UPI00265AAB74|nr:GDP-L-galactose phosphorylase 1-like [Magnolia sinica]
MVSVKQFEDDYHLWKQNTGSELSKCPRLPLSGNLSAIKIPLYRFGSQPAHGSGAYGGWSCSAEEEPSLLDSLLLAQWEDCAWKGLLRYDVTACETKLISGHWKFVAQLNEAWKSKCFTELEENKAPLQKLDPFKFNRMKTRREELLFCVASGEKAKSELITLSAVPNDANLIIINANPVEYGHVFLVPRNFYHQSCTLDARSLEMATRVAVEINNCSFRAFYDCPTSSRASHVYFQGCYFANPLPVELVPAMPVCGDWQKRGMQICEIADYPIKALLFDGNDNLKGLVNLVSEICSYLQDQETPFSLLISGCGTKMFLFPQVRTPATECDHFSAWQCGGHFVFKGRHDFDQVTEASLAKHLSTVSLEDDAFQSVKQLCCSVASNKLVS